MGLRKAGGRGISEVVAVPHVLSVGASAAAAKSHRMWTPTATSTPTSTPTPAPAAKSSLGNLLCLSCARLRPTGMVNFLINQRTFFLCVALLFLVDALKKPELMQK